MSSAVEKTGFTFIWKVENFSMLPHQKGESLVSPKFVVEEWEDTEWYLELYPRGDEDEESEGYISLFFCKIPDDVELKLTYALTLEATDPSLSKTVRGENTLTDSGRGLFKFFSLKDLNDKRNLYAPQDILTIRFHIDLPKDHSPELKDEVDVSDVLRKQITFRSGIKIQQRSITWSIKKPLSISDRTDKDLLQVYKDSPNLKVSLLFSRNKNDICIPIEIQQIGSTSFVNKSDRLFLKCKITVVNNNVKFRDSEESTHLFGMDLTEVWTFPLFLKTINLTHDKYLDANDSLNLQFDFVFSYKDDVYHWDTSYTPGPLGLMGKPQENEWCSSLKNTFTTGTLNDVTLKVGGESFPSYRAVLSAQFSVFRGMFENDMKEKNSGVVVIDDLEPRTVRRMLTFLHSGNLKEDLSSKDAADLYRAADKYNIAPLKQRCSTSLVSTLCVDSVCDVLVLADVQKDNFLWTAACNFVCSHATETLDSEPWKDLKKDNLNLAYKVMYLALTKKTPALEI